MTKDYRIVQRWAQSEETRRDRWEEWYWESPDWIWLAFMAVALSWVIGVIVYMLMTT